MTIPIPLTATEIIERFELQVDDLTELATQEELNLLNDIYLTDVCACGVPWEILKTAASGALALDPVTGLYYITIPDNFCYFVENNSYTDNTIGIDNNASPKVIFVGANYDPFQIVNYSDRVQYRTHSGVAYADMGAGKIYFPVAPSDTSFYLFDYIRIPEALGLNDSPIFPARFHNMFQFAMATRNEIMQLSAKANSYAPDNQAKFLDIMDKMRLWNANLILN